MLLTKSCLQNFKKNMLCPQHKTISSKSELTNELVHDLLQAFQPLARESFHVSKPRVEHPITLHCGHASSLVVSTLCL